MKPIIDLIDLKNTKLTVRECGPNHMTLRVHHINAPQPDMRQQFIDIVNRIRAKRGHSWELHANGVPCTYQTYFGDVCWPIFPGR